MAGCEREPGRCANLSQCQSSPDGGGGDSPIIDEPISDAPIITHAGDGEPFGLGATDDVVPAGATDTGVVDVFPGEGTADGSPYVEITLSESSSVADDAVVAIGGVPVDDLVRVNARTFRGRAAALAPGRRNVVISSSTGGASLWHGFTSRDWVASTRGRVRSTIEAVASHPDRPERVFAADELGTVFRSDDRAQTFRQVGPTFDDSRRPPQLAMSPADPDVLFGVFNGELGRSTNGGVSWRRITTGLDDISSLVTHHELLLAAGTLGGMPMLARSLDGGAIWEARRVPEFIGRLIPDRGNPQRLYGLASPLVRSDDGGVTWRRVGAAGLPRSVSLWMAETTRQGSLLVSDGQTVWRSSDGGESFSAVFQSPSNYWFVYGAVPHPEKPGRELLSTPSGLHSSNDDGATWQLLTTYGRISSSERLILAGNGDVYALEFWAGLKRVRTDDDQVERVGDGLDGSRVFAAALAQSRTPYLVDDIGTLHRLEPNKTWVSLGSTSVWNWKNLAVLTSKDGDRVFWDGRVRHPTGTEWEVSAYLVVIADPILSGHAIGLGPEGVTHVTTDGGDTWTVAAARAGGAAWRVGAARVTRDGTEYYAHDGAQLYRRTVDGGWMAWGPPKTFTEVRELAVGQSGAALVDSPSHGVFLLDAAGETWRELSPPLPNFGSRFAVGASVQGRDYLLAGYGGKVFRSEDGGKTWREGRLPVLSETLEFVVDPQNDRHVYGALGSRGFFESHNGGGFD